MIEKLNGFKPYVKLQVPTVYDDTLTYYETVTQVIAYLNDVIDKSNDLIDETNEFHVESREKAIQLRKEFEEFGDDVLNNLVPVEVVDTLNKWQQDGKLAHLINDQVFGMKANQVDLDETNAQLAETGKEFKTEKLLLKAENNSQIRPLLTIISDDGHADDLEMFEWFQARGVKAGVAMVTDYLEGENQYFNPTQLKQLYDAGWDIQLHDTLHRDMTTLSETQLDSAMRKGKNTLKKHGIECEGLVVPYGKINPLVSKVAERHFKYAFGENIGKRNTEGIATHNLQRIAHGNEYTWQHYKNAVDNAIRENAWSVVVTHWYQLNAEQKQLMMDMIDYARDQGVDIVTTKEALKVFGNTIEYQNYDTSDRFAVSNAGNVFSNNIINENNVVIDPVNNRTFDTPISDFENGKITYTVIAGTNANGFPENKPGLLITNRIHGADNGYQHQRYHLIASNTSYYRNTNGVGAFLPFVKEIKVRETIINTPETNVPSHGDAERVVTISGANYNSVINVYPMVNPPRGINYNILIHPNLNNIIIRLSNITGSQILIPPTEWTVTIG